MADTADLLRDVFARLDALERDNAQLKQHNALLQAEVARRPSTDANDRLPAAALERMSRRWLLRRGMQAAAATAVAGMVWSRDDQTAQAGVNEFGISIFNSACDGGGSFCGPDDPVISVSGTGDRHGIKAWSDSYNYDTIRSDNLASGQAFYGATTSNDRSAVVGENFGSDAGIFGRNHGTGAAIRGVAMGSGGTGVHGTGRYGVMGETSQAGFDGVFGRNNAASGNGVRGVGGTGVKGTSTSGIGVWGDGPNGVYGSSSSAGSGAVYGRHFGNGYGVVGDSAAAGLPGVLGRNSAGAGVKGEGGYGVWGVGNNGVVGDSTATDYGAVWGNHKGTSGYGVVGDGKGTGRSGVLGRNAAGEGVRGEGATGVRGTTTSGVGVAGEGGSGYGGVFRGIRAQVRLTPTGRIGKPTTGAHQVGELYLDRAGTLFICTVAGTPGTWRKFSTTAV